MRCQRPMLCLVLVVGTACSGLAQQDTNLIANGDFSAALEKWTRNDGNGAYTLRVDPEAKCDGKNSVLLRKEKAEVKGSGFLESQPVPVEPEGIYLLECKMKGSATPPTSSTPPASAMLVVSFFPSTDPARRQDVVVGSYRSSGPGPGGSMPSGTFDWQPFRCYYRVFAGRNAAKLRLESPGAGALWISDIKLTRVPALRNVKYEIRDAIPLPAVYGAAPEGYLTDGIFCWNQGADNAKITQGYRGLESGITLSLHLPQMTTVDRLVLSLIRVNPGHTLRKIEVYCNKYGQRVKAAEGPGYLTEEFDQRLWILDVPVRQKTDTIDLKLTGGGYLVPCEVMVVEDQTGRKERDVEVKRYALAGWFILAASASTAQQQPVVIENEYVRMEFCPVEGGVCKRMLYKPSNKELVYAYTDAGYGLFRDRFWSPTERDYGDVVYQHEVTRNPNGTSIHLWGRGAGGIYGFTEIHKTITLTAGSPLIQCEYEMKNAVDSMTDADYGFWVHNFLGVMGGKNEYFIPTTEGILEVWNDPENKPGNPELWIKNPARGWMAGIGEGRNGLAWGVDYKYLNLFYQFLGLAIPTCEWQYNRIRVPSGKSFKTEVTLMPFTGLDRVDGFFQGLAGGIVRPTESAPGNKISPTLGLVSASDRKLTLRFRSRLLPATSWRDLGTGEVELKKSAAQSVAWPQAVEIPAGTTVIGCGIVENGKEIGSMERPLVAGAPSGKYALAPEGPQVGSKEPPTIAETNLPEHKLSLEVVSPHVPWAKPYARGPIKALILADCGRQREIVELMQRFDLQAETEKLFYATSNEYFNEVGEKSVRTPEQAKARLKQKLQQPFDVLLIGGLYWDKTFDADAKKSIMDKVRAGMGLVYVAPVGVTGELRGALPFASGETKNGYGFMAVKQKHFLTDGVPYGLLPKIGGLSYGADTPEDRILLTHQGSSKPGQIPILRMDAIGKGRCICFSWDVYSHNLEGSGGWSFSRLTPLAENDNTGPGLKPGVMTDRGSRTITWRYWEYFYSLLGKSLLWAANREPDLAAEVIRREESGDVSVSVESPDDRRGMVLELTYRSKFSEDEKTDRQTVTLAKGRNTFRFTPPEGLMPGITLTDLRILTPEGKVVTWASGFYETRPAVQVTAVEFEKPILPAGTEPIVRGQVKLSAEAPADNVLEVTVTDAHDRLVGRQTLKASGTIVPFETHLLDVLSIPMKVEVRLKKGDQLLDKRTQTVLFLKRRTWDPRQCCQYEWYPTAFHGWSLPYLYDLGRQRAEQIGITSMMDNPVFALADVEGNTYTSPLCIWTIDDPRFAEKSNAYAKTRDRQNLVREPCLWDPAYREKARQAMRKAAETAMSYGGGYTYCLGDEMSLTSYNSYHDFDFAPASLAAYRDWLKKRYGTVEALNREWETAHKDWAEIEPMTADEARKRENGNYAPWADFRTFMDDSLADFFAYLQKCLEEVDPQAKISISGTQDATAGNGMDWWKLCHSLKAIHSYFSAETQYMHQAFSRTTGMLTAPYLHNACGRGSGPGVESRHWWGVFYECFGQTSLGTPNYFLPDLTFSEIGLDAKDYLAEVNGGIWMLMRSVRRDPAPIALLYSQPSIQGNFISNREQRTQRVRNAWVNLIHDMGLQFDFVAYAQLETPDFLAQHGYKALILPEAVALSQAETNQIKSFVQRGGVVIADNTVGWMDEHCRTLRAGRLDDLLGLVADRDPLPAGGVQLKVEQNWSTLKRGESITGFAPVGKVTPAKAEAVLSSGDPGSSAIYIRPFGKGKAVYLNLSLVPYREERQMGGRGETAFRQLIGGALALAGIKPETPIEPAGTQAFHGDVVHFTDQGTRYLGLIREYEPGTPEEAFTLRLPGRFDVYDVRARKHLGATDKITTVLYAGAAKLYCLSPAPLPAPTLDCPNKGALGAPFRCRLGVPAPAGRHTVVRLEVRDAAGTRRACYSGPHLLKPGARSVEASFVPAFNDPPGEWLIKAINIASGKEATKRVAIKE